MKHFIAQNPKRKAAYFILLIIKNNFKINCNSTIPLLCKYKSAISIPLITISGYTLIIINGKFIADNQRNFTDSDLENIRLVINKISIDSSQNLSNYESRKNNTVISIYACQCRKKRIEGIIIYGTDFATIRRDTGESVVLKIRAGVFVDSGLCCAAVFGRLGVQQPLKGGACSTACDTGSAGSKLCRHEEALHQTFLHPLFSLGIFCGTNQDDRSHRKRRIRKEPPPRFSSTTPSCYSLDFRNQEVLYRLRFPLIRMPKIILNIALFMTCARLNTFQDLDDSARYIDCGLCKFKKNRTNSSIIFEIILNIHLIDLWKLQSIVSSILFLICAEKTYELGLLKRRPQWALRIDDNGNPIFDISLQTQLPWKCIHLRPFASKYIIPFCSSRFIIKPDPGVGLQTVALRQ